MRHRNKGKTLGREKAPREAMFRNLASSLIIYEKIKTTEAKAKAIRPIVEKLITVAKKQMIEEKDKMMVEVKKEAVELVIAVAEKVVGKTFDAKAQKNLIEETLREVDKK